MTFSAGLRHPAARITALGLLACVLLTVRFSPNWLAFYAGLREARATAAELMPEPAVKQALYSAFSARGYYVLEQVRDLGTEIADPNHKIVRWRLLVPALGRWLHLPDWAVLGLAHLGCWVLVGVWVAMAYRHAGPGGRPAREALCFGLIAGAGAPFFTSMGLLGYYDSWLALALLAVAYLRPRSAVMVVCLLAPWVDERFVIGLPLALVVRRIGESDPAESVWRWLRTQALPPLGLAAGYTLLRLSLGGSGGSQTVSQYLHQFVLSGGISAGQRLLGAWEGLRFGWLPVLAALTGIWWASRPDCREFWWLSAGVVLTGLAGLFTALDMSRSMVLLVPVLPLGWRYLTRTARWNPPWLAPGLAAAALVVPADHVVGKYARRVDNFWSPSTPLVVSHNNLGLRLVDTPGREAQALAHFNATLRLDPRYADAHNNLALILWKMPGRLEEAERHFEEALRLRPDFAEAHNNLGLLYAGQPGRQAEALAHYEAALVSRPGYTDVYNNLGNLLATMPGRQEEALGRYATALRLRPSNAAAHYNVAILLASMPGRRDEAVMHYTESLRLNPNYGQTHNNLALLLADIPGRRDEALAHYAEALRLLPDFAEAHNNFALLLSAIPGRREEAVAHFMAAVRLLPGNATVRVNLAAQLEKLPGRTEEAVAHYRQALELNPGLTAAREGLNRLRR